MYIIWQVKNKFFFGLNVASKHAFIYQKNYDILLSVEIGNNHLLKVSSICGC